MCYIYTIESFCNKKECDTDTLCNTDKLWKHYAKQKKPVTKDHIFHDLHEIPEQANSQKQKAY